MQQHPIPRNITGFKFKLVGDMTLKQFGYLAVGVILGYLFFRFLPTPGIINFFVGILFAGGGAALAFLPLQGRPLDIWIKSFIKSVYSPTQYLWHKNNRPPAILLKPIKRGTIARADVADVDQKLNTYLQKKGAKLEDRLDKEEEKAIRQVENRGRKVEGGKGNEKGGRLKVEDGKQKTTVEAKVDKSANLSAYMPKMGVRILDDNQKTKSGFPKGQPKPLPNIVSGTVIGPGGKLLSNILVTIKDENKVTARALKTNTLGLFVSSIPLQNGVYYIEVEDQEGKFNFDIIKLTLHGSPFEPIEIVAKQVQTTVKPMNKQEEIKQKLFSKQSF
jgi:hypothetical protein